MPSEKKKLKVVSGDLRTKAEVSLLTMNLGGSKNNKSTATSWSWTKTRFPIEHGGDHNGKKGFLFEITVYNFPT